MNQCGLDGHYNGGLAVCDLPAGHVGEHREHWTDRTNRRRVLLAWSHMRGRDIVWPDVPGATRVTRDA